jgi:hypothetical protein
MSEIETQNVSVELNYYVGPDDPINGVFYSRPVDPEFTSELVVGVYTDDDDSTGHPPVLAGLPLQISVAGSARALEAMGKYLLALARINSSDPDLHEHFEDVCDERGGNLHLIVRRLQ